MLHEDTYYFNIIRANIKKERERKGLTQQQLADKTGITMNYLAKIESQKWDVVLLSLFLVALLMP